MEKEDIILQEVRALRSDVHEMWDVIVTLQVDTAKLQVKSGVWGLLAGLIPAIAVGLWIVLR